MIHFFKKPVSHLALPEKFTYPFHYTPHPLCVLAAEEVKEYIASRKEWQEELASGKMFGVLIVQTDNGITNNEENQIGYLAAFSGNLAGKNLHPYFVPPVYDLLQPEGFFKIEEEQISAINIRIRELENSSSYLDSKEKWKIETEQAKAVLNQAKAELKIAKEAREIRRQSSPELSEEEQASLIRESHLQKALPACRYCIMAREILLSKKTEQGLRLDPRTKLLLIFIISIFVMGGTGGEAMGLIRLVLCVVPAILLLTSKQCAKAVGYIAVFSVFYAVQIYVLPHLTGILNFLVLFTTGFFCRILPSVAIAAYAVKTTTVSELISGMERIHMPKEVTIPLTVMFRFFPTVFQESEAISDAMKMRGIKLGGKKSSKILEYKLIPMITCSVKIGEELSAAAITRGLGAPVKRTNICQLKFNFADVVLILFCCFVVFWAIASPIISAGGILP